MTRQKLEGGGVERYQLDWPGRRRALALSNQPTTQALRPSRDDSVDFDGTGNLFIEGDNLAALKLLQASYRGKVKMIYIDPPYNTGKDFIYKDDFRGDRKAHLEASGQRSADGARLVANLESNGRFHSDWLSFIHPRLRLARELLTENGVIFVSIDDNEQANLKQLCDQVFGSQNFVGIIVAQTNPRGRQLDKFLAKTFEYIVVYVKSQNDTSMNEIAKPQSTLDEYKHVDAHGRFRLLELRNTGSAQFNSRTRPNLFFPIYINPLNGSVSLEATEKHLETALPINSKNEDGCWTWGREKITNSRHLLVGKATKKGKWRVFRKDYIPDGGATSKPKALWVDKDINHGHGRKAVSDLFSSSAIFDFPKSVSLLRNLLRVGSKSNDIVLDFFAGSGTTAHAVMQQNAEDGGNRRFILVQLDEPVPEESEAARAGFNHIAEIARERIRRAGVQIKAGKFCEGWNGDVGFRTLKIDGSNMVDAYHHPDRLMQRDLLEHGNIIRQGRSGEDLLFQLLVDIGWPLTLPIDEVPTEGRQVFAVRHREDGASGSGALLLACFDDDIDEGLITALARQAPDLLILREGSVAAEKVRTNAEQIVKQLAPGTELRWIGLNAPPAGHAPAATRESTA